MLSSVCSVANQLEMLLFAVCSVFALAAPLEEGAHTFIVGLDRGAEAATTDQCMSFIDRVVSVYGSEVRRETLADLGAVALQFPGTDARRVEQIQRDLESWNGVDFVEVDRVIDHIMPHVEEDATTSTADVLRQFFLTAAHIPETWPFLSSKCTRPVRVMVIDSGLDVSHPYIADHVYKNPREFGGRPGVDDDHNSLVDDISGYNMHNDNNNVFDANGHGTHVAGIILATTNFRQVCSESSTSNVELVPCKFLGTNGFGTVLNAVKCMNYALHLNVDIINNSWGSKVFSSSCQRAFTEVQNRGIIVVSAAGNYSMDLQSTTYYPASYGGPGHLTVASSDREAKRISSFSNYGRSVVSVAAPGEEILSTVPGGRHRRISGTSQATPIVAGAAAMLKMVDATLRGPEVKALIEAGCDKKSPFDEYVRCGGTINVDRSIELSKHRTL